VQKFGASSRDRPSVTPTVDSTSAAIPAARLVIQKR
jgi:hypothetical protein